MKRRTPLLLLIAIDILLLGAFLCLFALHHHVIPRVDAIVPPTDLSGNRPPISLIPSPDESSDPDETRDVFSSESLPEESDPEAPTGPFSSGEILTTDTLYQSEDICITLTKYVDHFENSKKPTVYYVQDIYIRYVDNLRTALAKDSYGSGVYEDALKMAQDKNAVASINGDFYGISRTSGVVIRNGVLYRNVPDEDVLVMFYDGTMKTYDKDEFDAESVMAQGAYQAWCFGPSLLNEDGTVSDALSKHSLRYWNPRSAIGYIEPGHYCFVVAEGRSDESAGLTLPALGSLMSDLGCKVAYNLDGGQTSVITFQGQIVNELCEGGRPMSDIIYICEISQ